MIADLENTINQTSSGFNSGSCHLDHHSGLSFLETSFLLLPAQSKDPSVWVFPSRLPHPPTTHHSCFQTSSLIYLWGEGEGKSWHLLTCADHSRKNLPWLPFVFNVGPFNMQSPPNLSNLKYLHTLVSGHPICVHGQLDCISSQSPFTRSIWARIWVGKIEANIKSQTYYSSVTV